MGRIKQLAPVGPGGEIIMDYSIHDALEAGFNKIILSSARIWRKILRRLSATGLRSWLRWSTRIRSWMTFRMGIRFRRAEKTLGYRSGCADDQRAGKRAFLVINADDYYGIDAYRTIYDELVKLPETGKATMVGYLLKNTASLHGTVSRGVCAVEDGKLRSVREALKIQLYPDGTLRDLAEGTDLSPETVVSMNFWGFAPSIFPALREYFENFLRTEAGENIKAECLLPVMVGDQLQKGALEVSVLHSADKWFGMTYHEDREIVAEELRKLHARGDYPESLRV